MIEDSDELERLTVMGEAIGRGIGQALSQHFVTISELKVSIAEIKAKVDGMPYLLDDHEKRLRRLEWVLAWSIGGFTVLQILLKFLPIPWIIK